MICVIRIRGRVGIERNANETLDRLRLRRKYACVVVQEKEEILGMVKKVRDFVAFGKISRDALEKLIEKRGRQIDKSKKISPKSAAEGLEEGKSPEDMNLKPFFRLHPPRKGISGKIHFPRGALGNHGDKINELLERML
jgi:large subunit ribosomal protein L30